MAVVIVLAVGDNYDTTEAIMVVVIVVSVVVDNYYTSLIIVVVVIIVTHGFMNTTLFLIYSRFCHEYFFPTIILFTFFH